MPDVPDAAAPRTPDRPHAVAARPAHVVAPATTLVDTSALRTARTARERFAALDDLADERLVGTQLRDVLVLVPDGWQRRRAARRLLTAGHVDDVDADAVLRSFARASDRSAVASDLVDADLALIDVVADVLDGPHVARLRRRVAARSG